MKVIIIAFLFLSVLSQETHIFRFQNGVLNENSKTYNNVSGTFLIIESSPGKYAFNYMGMDMTVMASYFIAGTSNTDSISKFGVDSSIPCKFGISYTSRNPFEMAGEMKLVGDWVTMDIEARCNSLDKRKEWYIKAHGVSTNKWFYEPKEAARRAMKLVGLSNRMLNGQTIVKYAIMDSPISKFSCNTIIDFFKPIYDEEPGAIIISAGGDDCGILDDTGHAFIHSNSATRKVAIAPMKYARRYFKSGFIFRAYPSDPSLI